MKKQNINIQIRIPKALHETMLTDLKRPHKFAAERVGFLFTKSKYLNESTVLIIATEYQPVEDWDYIEDNSVGASFNSDSIAKAMQGALDRQSGCFHVHLHAHKGKPYPSYTDKNGLPGVVHSLSNIASKQANGILILSENAFYSEIKIGRETTFHNAQTISVVGYPMAFQFLEPVKTKSNIYDRQSFLGLNAQIIMENIKVGIIGYGGGGSHIGQQLAHLGIKNIFVFDDDKVEDTNLNRLIGAWYTDVKNKVPKTTVAKRIIKKVLPAAKVTAINSKWQNNAELLQLCEIVIGCVDSLNERNQLEAECRRYLIPYIDIGMDIYKIDDLKYSMSGQIILSMPGTACMKCYGYITEEDLGKEHAKYGDAGGRPQVVWANGVLASSAIGILVDLVTEWAASKDKLIYLSYYGNSGHLIDNIRKRFAPKKCEHYPLEMLGPPIFRKL